MDLDRDEERRVASVRVRPHGAREYDPGDDGVVNDEFLAEVAELLAARAERFLGPSWTVVRWEPPPYPAPDGK